MSDSGKITVNYFCLGAFFIFIGSVLLCALGFTVVLPFEVTRAWPTVACTVVNSSYEPNVCSCDEQLNVFDTCVSKYPCLQIHVFYVPPLGRGGGALLQNRSAAREGFNGRRRRQSPALAQDGNASVGFLPEGVADGETTSAGQGATDPGSYGLGSTMEVGRVTTLAAPWGEGEGEVLSGAGRNWTEGPLRRSEMERKGIDGAREAANLGANRVFATLYRSWDDSFNRQCTLTECGDESWNVKEARRFRDDWGRLGQSFPCFYNPLRPDTVIIERTSTVAAVHAVLWPGLCLIGGITLWLGLCLGCWSLGSDSTCKDDYGPIY